MIKIDRNSSYLEVKEFLEDIYIHLNNQCINEPELTVDYERKELINRCEHILNIFQLGFDTPDTEHPYLDMSAHNTPESPSEYVDVTPSASDDCHNISDLYDHCSIDRQLSGDILEMFSCPFNELPACQLIIKNAVKTGFINRIEKRIFFDQTKKYYAGVLNGWLLLYAGGLTDTTPAICCQLSKCDLCQTVDMTNSKKRELTFQLNDRSRKKYLFQANSINDLNEWLTAILDETKSQTNEPLTRSNTCRKLPTPPLQNLYINQRASNRSEDIYEEPTEMISNSQNQQSCNIENNSYDNVHSCENRYDQLAPPVLPVKLGKKTINNQDSEIVDYDIPKTPIKLTNNTTPIETHSDEDYQIKIKNIKSKLNTQLLSTGLSPEKQKHMNKNKSTLNDTTLNKKPLIPNRTPVRSWFLNRLSKSTTKSIKINQFDNNGGMECETKTPTGFKQVPLAVSTAKFAVKGGKVNMIINQLEANGHLPILTKGINERRHYNYDEDNDDGHNYELVAITSEK